METLQLGVKERGHLGKSDARKMRRDGFIPAVLYGGESNHSIAINSKELIKILENVAGRNAILNLKFEGKGKKDCTAIVKDLQKHPLRREILHADLMEISMDKEIKVKIRVKLTGEPVGVKQKGGILSLQLREIKVSCLPSNIPNDITIDVSNLDVGHAIHVKDVLVGEGIKILEDFDATVASVNMPKVEEVKVEVPVAEAAPAEGAVAAAPAEEKGKIEEKEKTEEKAKPEEKKKGK